MYRIFILLLFIAACAHEPEITRIANEHEVLRLLSRKSDDALSWCDQEIAFWEKRPQDFTAMSKIGGLYASRFKISGQVSDLTRSDSLLNQILEQFKMRTPEVYHMLAANAITQHRFQEARELISRAYEIGDNMSTTLLMSMDVDLELGYVDTARETLRKFTNQSSFACLIRRSRLKDHEGDLDSAIILMEMALERVQNNKSLFCWARSNLGDMYGHAGRIADSYSAHLEVLNVDPEYDHSLKSIAWIAFSHDHNTDLSRKILDHLLRVRPTPDYELLLAQIAHSEGKFEEEAQLLESYSERVSQKYYGVMYAKYLALLHAEKLSNPFETIAIAEEEISRRPCAQSYDLLGWGYYHTGDPEKALDIVRGYVEEATYEPEALYHMGIIYKANGLKKQALRYLEEAKRSAFELGPEIAESIEVALKELG